MTALCSPTILSHQHVLKPPDSVGLMEAGMEMAGADGTSPVMIWTFTDYPETTKAFKRKADEREYFQQLSLRREEDSAATPAAVCVDTAAMLRKSV